MAFDRAHADEEVTGYLAVGLPEPDQRGDPAFDWRELAIGAVPTADAGELGASGLRLDRSAQRGEVSVCHLQVVPGLAPAAGPSQYRAEQQASPGFLERHRQTFVVGHRLLQRRDRQWQVTADCVQQAVAAPAHRGGPVGSDPAPAGLHRPLDAGVDH